MNVPPARRAGTAHLHFTISYYLWGRGRPHPGRGHVKRMKERISYWLVPVAGDKERVEEIIRQLAARFGAPVFEPHVTVYSGPLGPRDNLSEVVAATAMEISELVLQSNGIAHSERFTKTLFVEFAANEILTKLSEALKRRSAQPADYELKPHLSLIYAPLAPADRERFADEIVLPSTVRFDSLKAILSTEQVQTREDVEAWRVVAEQKLTGRGSR
jgi:hypothetical protein